jgi:hypothetical protein
MNLSSPAKYKSWPGLKYFLIAVMTILVGNSAYTQVPLNWTRDEINPGEDFTLTADESSFTEGVKSCHMQLNTGAVPYLVSDVFYVTPGAAYEFSFDVLDQDTSGQVKVYADFFDTYGFDIFGQPPVFSTDSTGWKTVRWEGTVPGLAVVGFVLIKFYCQPQLYVFNETAHIWVDNIRFHENGGANLVLNGGFEDWTTGIDETVHGNLSLSVYPNPTADILKIGLPGKVNSVFIYDITGRMVLKRINIAQEVSEFNVSQLQKGFYLINAILEEGRVISGNFIKD